MRGGLGCTASGADSGLAVGTHSLLVDCLVSFTGSLAGLWLHPARDSGVCFVALSGGETSRQAAFDLLRALGAPSKQDTNVCDVVIFNYP